MSPRIIIHQRYTNHGIATSERAVEGASHYNSEITASPEHWRTMFAPTDVCGVIKGYGINNNAKCQGGGLSRTPAPTFDCLICYAAKSLRSVLFFTLCLFFSLVSFAHSSFLTPHSSFLTPHSSLLIPHSSFLTPHSSLKSLYRLTKPL